MINDDKNFFFHKKLIRQIKISRDTSVTSKMFKLLTIFAIISFATQACGKIQLYDNGSINETKGGLISEIVSL